MFANLVGLCISTAFFALLLASGAFVFGSKMGSTTRGTVVPLLFVPLLADWIRFVANISFLNCFLIALIIYAIGALAILYKIGGLHGNLFKRNFSVLWKVTIILTLLNVLIRTWVFTGSVPNPADDNWGGYKTSALYHATGWPAIATDAEGISYAYYYFLYTWPAALAGFFGVNFWFGTWITDVLFCVLGSLLTFEVVKPRIDSRCSVQAYSFLLVCGASFGLFLAIALRVSPHDFGSILRAVLPDNLDVSSPRSDGTYWMPFAVFCTGLLFTALHLLLQQWRHRVLPIRLAFVILVISALAGYSTIHLIGFALICLPFLLIIVVRDLPVNRRLPAIGSLFFIGAVSLLAGLPLITELVGRHQQPASGNNYGLFIWIGNYSSAYSTASLVKFGILIALVWLVSNPLAIVSFFNKKNNRRPFFMWLCAAIFIWGSLISLSGILDLFKLAHEFSHKFEGTIALAGIFLFFQIESERKWLSIFFALALIGPAFFIVNTVRANIQCAKLDPVWKTIDAKCNNEKIPVYYYLTDEDRHKELPWVKFAPFNSRAHFQMPTGQVDPHSFVYLQSGSITLNTEYPFDINRLKKQYPNASQYLLLTRPQPNVENVLYESSNFQLSIHPMPR